MTEYEDWVRRTVNSWTFSFHAHCTYIFKKNAMLILDIFQYLKSKSEDKKLCISTFSLYFLKESIIFRETTPGVSCNFFDLLEFFVLNFFSWCQMRCWQTMWKRQCPFPEKCQKMANMADMPNNSILNKILTSIENEFDFFARVTTNFLQKSACSADPEK